MSKCIKKEAYGLLREEQKFDFLTKEVRAFFTKALMYLVLHSLLKGNNQGIKPTFPGSFSLPSFGRIRMLVFSYNCYSQNLGTNTFLQLQQRARDEKGWTHVAYSSVSGKRTFPWVDSATFWLYSQSLNLKADHILSFFLTWDVQKLECILRTTVF